MAPVHADLLWVQHKANSSTFNHAADRRPNRIYADLGTKRGPDHRADPVPIVGTDDFAEPVANDPPHPSAESVAEPEPDAVTDFATVHFANPIAVPDPDAVADSEPYASANPIADPEINRSSVSITKPVSDPGAHHH